jgi:hypothetical protein
MRLYRSTKVRGCQIRENTHKGRPPPGPALMQQPIYGPRLLVRHLQVGGVLIEVAP